MTIPACRKAVFGLLVTTLFSSLLTEVNAAIDCKYLKDSSKKNDFLTCAEAKMRIEAKDGAYPIADFSAFSQEEFNNSMIAKGDNGLPDPAFKRYFCGNFLAKKSKLTSVSIGFYVSDKEISQSLVLEGNWNLKDVNITTPTNETFGLPITMTFTIRNNKMLSEASIAHLKSIPYILPSSYIQDHGECDFHGAALEALDHLEYCKYIVGDLIIDSSTNTHTTKTIDFTKLNGCLRIKESSIDNIDFLKNVEVGSCAKHEILENENLCINPEQVSDLKKKLNNVLTYKDKGNCVGVCSSKYFMENKETDCVIIEGNLKISKEHEGDLSFLKEIQQIRGRLIIHSTNFTNVDFFPNLKIVNDSASEDKEGFGTIEIMYNAQLDNVSFPALENIIVGKENKKKIYIKENGGNHLSEGVRSYFEDKFGKDSVTISVPKPPAPPARTAQQIEEEAAEEERKRKEAETLSGTSITMLIVVAIVVPIIICVVIIVVLVVIGCRRRAKWIKNARNYKLVDPTLLEIPKFVTVKYNQSLPWMKDAEEVISKNVERINVEAKRMEKDRLEDYNVLVYKNSEAVARICSRNDDLKNIHFIQKAKKGEKWACPNNCKYSEWKRNIHPPECLSPCKCTDIGVRCSNGYAFGIRMEKKPKEWGRDKERCHYSLAAIYKLPTVYEETSNATMIRMAKIGKAMISEENSWQEEQGAIETTNITSRKIKLSKSERETVQERKDAMKKRRQELKCSTMYYKISVSHFQGDEHLSEFKSVPVNVKTPALWRHTFKMYGKRDSVYFVKTMMYVHMNAPRGQWVGNYTADDFINLCKLTQTAIEDTTSGVMNVCVANANVRIIGQILGDFDSLRKGLCHKSMNQVEGEHPVCHVKHIFLGNLVGPKGSNLEVLCLLFALKCSYPENYLMLRGALEWTEMNEVSGLQQEVVLRFPDNSIDVLDAIAKVFAVLPFTCKVGENIFCSHAGVAPRMDDVMVTKLPIKELVPDTLAFNLVFAQPNYTVKRFFDNVEQGAGYYFGDEAMDDIVAQFSCTALICTKSVNGYGVFGQVDRLMYAITGTNEKGKRISQIEFDHEGQMHIQVIYL